LGDAVKSGATTFSNFIYDPHYFLTPFDLWVLLQKYQIASFFISQEFLLQTEYKQKIFLTYGDLGDTFVFIVIPGLRQQNIPGYKIIETNRQEIFISLDIFNETKCSDLINDAFRNVTSVEDYLNQFTKQSTTKYMKKKPRLIIEEDAEIEIIGKEEKQKQSPTNTKTKKQQTKSATKTRKNKKNENV
jgi:hypothetical protein